MRVHLLFSVFSKHHHVGRALFRNNRKHRGLSWDPGSTIWIQWVHSCMLSSFDCSVGGRHWEDMIARYYSWAGSRQLEVFYLLPCLWDVCFPHHSHNGSQFQGCNLQKTRCCWDQFVRLHDWTQLRAPYKLLRFCWVWAEIYLSFSCQDKTLMEIPCLLNLPPTNLGGLPVLGPVFRFHLGVSQGFQPSS